MEDGTEREREVIKHMSESQVTSTLIGEVTVSFPLKNVSAKKSTKKKRKK